MNRIGIANSKKKYIDDRGDVLICHPCVVQTLPERLTAVFHSYDLSGMSFLTNDKIMKISSGDRFPIRGQLPVI